MSTTRYVVSSQEIDVAKINKPAHIEICDSMTGWGAHCKKVRCGGVAVEDGVEAIRAVYPDIQVTANRSKASRIARRIVPTG